MPWRDMRGRTKEMHKELQDLDPIVSPQLEVAFKKLPDMPINIPISHESLSER
jgi:hypothetical protein